MAVFAFLFGQRKIFERIFEQNKRKLFLFVISLFQLGYLALGAFLFITIEGANEVSNLKVLKSVKSTMLMKYTNLTGAMIDDLYHELAAHGVRDITSDNTTKWTFGNSFLFSATLLTTIGYGHLSPRSALGKSICIVYSTLGIPLMLLTMSCYLEKFTALSGTFKANLFRRLGNRYPLGVRLTHISIIMSFILVGCFLLPAAVFDWLEADWTYLDAIYFCFISLTTVGLGDFVPGIAAHHAHVELYRFGATIYLIAGVTVMMFMLAAMGDFIQNYNAPYTILPVAILPDKYPIKISDPPSYGAIEVIKTESSDEKRRLLDV